MIASPPDSSLAVTASAELSAQASLARTLIKAVAFEAGVGEDRANLAIEIDLRLGSRGQACR